MLTVLTETHSCLLDTGALDVIISCGEPDHFKGWEARVNLRGGHTPRFHETEPALL